MADIGVRYVMRMLATSLLTLELELNCTYLSHRESSLGRIQDAEIMSRKSSLGDGVSYVRSSAVDHRNLERTTREFCPLE